MEERPVHASQTPERARGGGVEISLPAHPTNLHLQSNVTSTLRVPLNILLAIVRADPPAHPEAEAVSVVSSFGTVVCVGGEVSRFWSSNPTYLPSAYCPNSRLPVV